MPCSPARSADLADSSLQWVIKNTFVSLEDNDEKLHCSQRSVSVPRAWKLSPSKAHPLSPSTASTCADSEVSDDGSGADGRSPKPELGEEFPSSSSSCGPVPAAARAPGATSLNASATAFVPAGFAGASEVVPPVALFCSPPATLAAPQQQQQPQPQQLQPLQMQSPHGCFQQAMPSSPMLSPPSLCQNLPDQVPPLPGGSSHFCGGAPPRPVPQAFQPSHPGRHSAAPSVTLPVHAEIKSAIRPVVQALQGHPSAKDVAVTEGRMGAVTTIAVEVHPKAMKGDTVRKMMSDAKEMLLHAAEKSASTYVLGYEEKPFEDEADGGFHAKLGMVPFAMQGLACWETYRKGFCSCREYCCFAHPGDEDLAPIRIVVVKK